MNSGSLPRGVETQLTGGGCAALALCAVSLFCFSLDFALIVSDYLCSFIFKISFFLSFFSIYPVISVAFNRRIGPHTLTY